MTTRPLSLPSVQTWQLDLVERDVVPDAVLRAAIRAVCRERIVELEAGGVEAAGRREEAFVRTLRASPITIHTREANEQHYELPPRFFELVLGPHRKYSCCEYADGENDYRASLGDAEARMLARTVEMAGIEDGDEVLELGCGWGSLTLYVAERFPNARITGISNSRPQREYILGQAEARGLRNVTIRTGDVATIDFGEARSFDRVVSVEMFEHARNWEALFAKVARVMRDDATFFLHVFTHARHSYPYEVRSPSDFIARFFFTGGMMPSDALAHRFQRELEIVRHERVSGTHYQKTAEAWLVGMDQHRDEIEALFREVYGPSEVTRWWVRWRIFFLACAELWGYRDGNEWHVSHYLMRPNRSTST